MPFLRLRNGLERGWRQRQKSEMVAEKCKPVPASLCIQGVAGVVEFGLLLT